jgi:hypothetical protein
MEEEVAHEDGGADEGPGQGQQQPLLDIGPHIGGIDPSVREELKALRKSEFAFYGIVLYERA